MSLLIKNAKVLTRPEKTVDIAVRDGVIAEIAELINGEFDTVFNAEGMVLAPGLADIHAHLREPGYVYKEDIRSGLESAACGGFTSVFCMPNTDPVIDNVITLKHVIKRGSDVGFASLYPIAAVTTGQNGEHLTPFSALRKAGAVAFSDDGRAVMSAAVMREALMRAKQVGAVIISHCEDETLVDDACINEGAVSDLLTIKGRPVIAEDIMVMRDCMLAQDTGAPVHIAHVSSAGAVDIIRNAKKKGVRITCETCPQYFTFTEDEVLKKAAIAKMNPPLRTKEDVKAVIAGLVDGTIDAIATDHAPHDRKEKSLPLSRAPSGMVGFETALAASITALCRPGHLSLERVLELMSSKPLSIFGMRCGKLEKGEAADLVIFDPQRQWTVNSDLFKSKSGNTPFNDMQLTGLVAASICRGELYINENFKGL